MNIAMLSQTYPPMISGAALAAQQLAEGMAERGHSVLVITASDHDQAYTTRKPNCCIERLASWHNPLRAEQRFNPWPYHATLHQLREFAPDVIHAHEPFLMLWAGIAYRKQTRIPILLTTHQLPWFITPYLDAYGWLAACIEKVFWMYARSMLRQVTIAVAPTQTTAEAVLDQVGILPRVISYGVDLQAFRTAAPPEQMEQLRLKHGIPFQAPVILHVGRLDKDKRVERVVEAAVLAMRQTDAHLLVVGDGTEKTRLVDLCRRAGIQERSHFPGFISSRDELSSTYRLADVFATASEIETQGIVLLEAAASGLPIVAVRATCIPEIVVEGRNGYLCQSGDTPGLAGRVAHLVANPALARQMGLAGRELIEKHAIQHTMDAYEALYGEVSQPAIQPSGQPIPANTWRDRAKRSGASD